MHVEYVKSFVHKFFAEFVVFSFYSKITMSKMRNLCSSPHDHVVNERFCSSQ